jgi:hypothetical protein
VKITPTEDAVLRGLLAEVLPIEAPRARLELAEGPILVDGFGWLGVEVLAATIGRDGSVFEAMTGTIRLVHREDLEPAQRARTRAFLDGWADAQKRRFVEQWRIQTPAGMLAGLGPIGILEDLRWQTREEFADAVERDAWSGSGPDWTLYPDLSSRPTPVAEDPAREELLRGAPDREAMLAYLRWLDERGDPRGAFGLDQASDREIARRRARQRLRDHRDYLAGPFPIGEPDEAWREVELDWELGWIARAVVRLSLDGEGPAPDAILRALLELPSARLIRVLVLSIVAGAHDDPRLHRAPSWSALLETPAPSLRRLVIERSPSVMTEPEDEAKLRRLFIGLQELLVA